MNKQAIRVTQPPLHHFFGFHDIPAWNFSGDKLLSLEVNAINRPPLPMEPAGVGYVDTEGQFNKIGSTCAFNYPQGSRIQWVGKSDFFITNNLFGNQCSCDIYDTKANKLADKYPFSCYCLHKDEKTVFSINYSRLHRLGAYGYPGLKDFTASEALPDNDGITIGNLATRETRLLVSIKDVANHPDKILYKPHGHHYLTHLVLNPSHTRLAFLHRYPLADGGEITRLMSIGIDGIGLRCLATGYLSHFDWKDDNTIFIFGRANSQLDALRSNPILSLPLVADVARITKYFLKIFIKPTVIANTNFLLISDRDDIILKKIALNVLTEDGHPMFCPTNRDWIVNDTYPNSGGIRYLMLYQFSQNRRIDLECYKMINDKPDMEEANLFFEGVEQHILNTIGNENLAFTRSGLHCDLHPRWNMQGDKIAFDSIHEGTRQIYILNVRDILSCL